MVRSHCEKSFKVCNDGNDRLETPIAVGIADADNRTLSSPQLSAVLNLMQAERKKREKARKAATKVGQPLFEEDGKRRSILDKYDEEEEEAGLQIGLGGAVGGDDVARRQAEIRSRLAGVASSTC